MFIKGYVATISLHCPQLRRITQKAVFQSHKVPLVLMNCIDKKIVHKNMHYYLIPYNLHENTRSLVSAPSCCLPPGPSSASADLSHWCRARLIYASPSIPPSTACSRCQLTGWRCGRRLQSQSCTCPLPIPSSPPTSPSYRCGFIKPHTPLTPLGIFVQVLLTVLLGAVHFIDHPASKIGRAKFHSIEKDFYLLLHNLGVHWSWVKSGSAVTV